MLFQLYHLFNIIQISSNEPENDMTDLMIEESADISEDAGGIIMFSLNRMFPPFLFSSFVPGFL